MDSKVYKLTTTLIFITASLLVQAEGEERYTRIKTCTYDSECVENAYCGKENYCQCKEGFVFFVTGQDSFLCLKEASWTGDACEEDIQCTKPFGNHAECIVRNSGAGECSCMNGAHFKDGRCYEKALIGQKCKVSNECYLASGQPAYCDRSVCTCQNGYHSNEDGTDCIRTRQLDESCDTDRECVTENARCGYVCRCKVNYIQSRQNDRCLKAADKMGDPCVEDQQCKMFLDRAICDVNGHCSCSPGFHHIPPNSKCYSNIWLGGTCEETAECVVPSAVCSEGICQCQPGFSASADNSKCNGLGGRCEGTAECVVPSAVCSEGICQCQPGFRASADNSKCNGDNGQKAVHHSLNVLLVTLILPRLFQYFNSST